MTDRPRPAAGAARGSRDRPATPGKCAATPRPAERKPQRLYAPRESCPAGPPGCPASQPARHGLSSRDHPWQQGQARLPQETLRKPAITHTAMVPCPGRGTRRRASRWPQSAAAGRALPGGRGLLRRRGRHAQPNGKGQDSRRTLERLGLAAHQLGQRGELEPAHCGLVDITARVHRGRQPRVALAERWDGSTWTIQRVPDVNRIGYTELTAVSCSSASACLAAGTYDG